MTVAERLLNKYGVIVRDDSYWNPLKQRYVKRYKMFSADGCPWDNGLTLRQCERECERYAEVLIKIKNLTKTEV